jgi:hypothetical protein
MRKLNPRKGRGQSVSSETISSNRQCNNNNLQHAKTNMIMLVINMIRGHSISLLNNITNKIPLINNITNKIPLINTINNKDLLTNNINNHRCNNSSKRQLHSLITTVHPKGTSSDTVEVAIG